MNVSEHPIFVGVNSDWVDRWAAKAVVKRYQKGERIITQGDLAEYVCLLTEGRIEVYAEAKNGEKSICIFHEAPAMVGQVEIWRHQNYLANVLALEPCEAYVLNKEKYLQLLHSQHQVCINIVRILSDVFCRTAEERRVRLFGQMDHLVANTLCSIAKLYGESHDYGILINRELNKSELAEIIGVSRKSIIQAMKNLEAEGLVQLNNKQLVIPNIALLKAKALSRFT